MLLSKVYSHVLPPFVHGIFQSIDDLFWDTCSIQVLVAFPWETKRDIWAMETPVTAILVSQYLNGLCSQNTHSWTLSSTGDIIVSSVYSAVHERQYFKNWLWSEMEAEGEFFCCLYSCCLQTLMLSRAEIHNAENLHIIKCLLFC